MSNYCLLATLFGWVFRKKEDRREFRYFCRKIDERKSVAKIHQRYQKTIERLKEKFGKEKIKVLFLNDTLAKWQYQALYDELSTNKDFEVQIAVSVLNYHTRKDMKKVIDYKQEAKKSYEFFRSKGMNVAYAFDFEKETPIDLRAFSPDIIFYEQPWALHEIHNIEETSKFALTCYSSYGAAITNGKQEYSSVFYKYLFRYFIDNEHTRVLLLSHGANEESVLVSGHPKLDLYLTPINPKNTYWKGIGKKRIIYAPHFSFHKDAGLHYGTFDKNGQFFLDYAKQHPEFEFVFKPHPRLKEDIVRYKFMSEEDCEKYYNEWATLPNTQLVDGANYVDMFRESDLMITDCNSFLLEYLPTTNPVIHLKAKDSVGHSDYGKKLIGGYYAVCNMEELKESLSNLLEKDNDYLKPKREAIIQKHLNQPKEGCSKFVVSNITELLS